MSVVRRTLDGERSTGHLEDMALRYCTDSDLRREAALEMFKMRLLGIPRKKVAKKYRISPRYVSMLIKFIPEDQKDRIRARFQSVG
jgi:hypothetical protein